MPALTLEHDEPQKAGENVVQSSLRSGQPLAAWRKPIGFDWETRPGWTRPEGVRWNCQL